MWASSNLLCPHAKTACTVSHSSYMHPRPPSSLHLLKTACTVPLTLTHPARHSYYTMTHAQCVSVTLATHPAPVLCAECCVRIREVHQEGQRVANVVHVHVCGLGRELCERYAQFVCAPRGDKSPVCSFGWAGLCYQANFIRQRACQATADSRLCLAVAMCPWQHSPDHSTETPSSNTCACMRRPSEEVEVAHRQRICM